MTQEEKRIIELETELKTLNKVIETLSNGGPTGKVFVTTTDKETIMTSKK